MRTSSRSGRIERTIRSRPCSTTCRSTSRRGPLQEPLPWKNSTLLEGDAAEAIAKLKQQPGDDLTILGSGTLIHSLAARGLVDRYVLLIHPLVMGKGLRLFTDSAAFAKLRLVNSITTTTGVIIATYEAT